MKSIRLLLLLSGIFILTGCGGEEEEAPPAAAGGDGGSSTNAPAEPVISKADIRKDAENAIKECDIEALTKLLDENEFLLNHVNKKRDALIHTACKTACIDAVKLLVDREVKLDVKNMIGCAPIHCAAGWSNLDMVKYVVSIGGDINEVTDKGRSVKSFADNNFFNSSKDEQRKIAQYLIDSGVEKF